MYDGISERNAAEVGYLFMLPVSAEKPTNILEIEWYGFPLGHGKRIKICLVFNRI